MMGEAIREARRTVREAQQRVEDLARLEQRKQDGVTAERLREAAGEIQRAMATLTAVYGTEEWK